MESRELMPLNERGFLPAHFIGDNSFCDILVVDGRLTPIVSAAATHPPLGRNRFFHHPGSFSQDRDDLVEQSRSDSPTQPPPAAGPGVKKHLN
ncbi:Mechanosensitive ion channel MscS [Penicillium chrysogenum]|nr:Mechanosensitive ion channel MscS [Penicillium chrysogenum]